MAARKNGKSYPEPEHRSILEIFETGLTDAESLHYFGKVVKTASEIDSDEETIDVEIDQPEPSKSIPESKKAGNKNQQSARPKTSAKRVGKLGLKTKKKQAAAPRKPKAAAARKPKAAAPRKPKAAAARKQQTASNQEIVPWTPIRSGTPPANPAQNIKKHARYMQWDAEKTLKFAQKNIGKHLRIVYSDRPAALNKKTGGISGHPYLINYTREAVIKGMKDLIWYIIRLIRHESQPSKYPMPVSLDGDELAEESLNPDPFSREGGRTFAQQSRKMKQKLMKQKTVKSQQPRPEDCPYKSIQDHTEGGPAKKSKLSKANTSVFMVDDLEKQN